jgi:hypothetical protein
MTLPEGPARQDDGRPTGREVVEVPLLLPRAQAAALNRAAHARGLTAAAVMRRLVRGFLVRTRGRRHGPGPGAPGAHP